MVENPGPLLPPPPPAQLSRRDVVRFIAVHLLFLAACFGVGEFVFIVLGHSMVYEFGPGKEFPDIDSAREAIDVQIARAWMAVGVFSSLVVLGVWLWKRTYRWFWIPLAFVPYVGPVIFASPATWVLANRRAKPREYRRPRSGSSLPA